MSVRIEGSLVKWNKERGFGFIAPDQGGPDVFVHAVAFPHDGIRPYVGERLSFEIGVDADGRKRARNLQRISRQAKVRPQPRPAAQKRKRGSGLAQGLVLALIIAGLAYHLYGEYTSFRQQQAAVDPPAARVESSHYRCDGRSLCSEMRSCAEATYFLQHCPGVEMDGDGDGIPCEQQWCSGVWTR
ncbi:cold shock domain-containing protein [Zoogloea sp.]|uniref:cold shock domain-containing protein n=1 Tax=Zoogloea sp. TaxID=49181 RepID=UPI0035AF3017